MPIIKFNGSEIDIEYGLTEKHAIWVNVKMAEGELAFVIDPTENSIGLFLPENDGYGTKPNFHSNDINELITQFFIWSLNL